MDEDTPEQKAATLALKDAVEGYARAYEMQGILTDFVGLGSFQRWDDDGRAITTVGSMFINDSTPHYRLLGLVEFAGARWRKEITDDSED